MAHFRLERSTRGAVRFLRVIPHLGIPMLFKDVVILAQTVIVRVGQIKEMFITFFVPARIVLSLDLSFMTLAILSTKHSLSV
jgi:hypothetical protein